ncbi:DUF4910 domain-containing protein [Halorussus salinus]|uniref:DUF4910 domain-containing protein n=1 Tax=Halorussus salinus TaxID=1364935 RepID=UPI001092F50A|nr:DUF4910 domain-containing protein [Halorussus salinus]
MGHETDADDEQRVRELYDELYPICRSITGPGLRESLGILGEEFPLEVEGVPSGTDVFDWTIPDEWHIREARLVGPDDEVYADFEDHNLSVVNYSAPVDRDVSLSELQSHLYSSEGVPEAIPYVTSYYERHWGFCVPETVRKSMPEGEYHAYVDSEFVDGELNYGHALLDGETDDEVLLSSYLCHPSMANNELSGPLVMALLYDRIADWDDRRYTYRFVLCPETIGSLAYLHRYGDHLRERVVGGLVLTCLGGPEPNLSYKRSREDDALLDRLVEQRARRGEPVETRPFAEMFGSDERQYCSAGFDLPVGQVARTVYGEYDEYHTSADDREFVELESLVESADWIADRLWEFEHAGRQRNLEPYGEPMLSKHDLFPTVSDWSDQTRQLTGVEELSEEQFLKRVLLVLQYSDGDHDLVEIADERDCTVEELVPIVRRLYDEQLLEPLG